MDLHAPGLKNAVVRLELLGPEHRETLRGSGAVDAMWRWMPFVPNGNDFDNYFDYTLQIKASGDAAPFAVFEQSTGEFAGVVGFYDFSRIHRRVQIGNVWHPPHMRGGPVFPATQALMIRRALDWRAKRITWIANVRNAKISAAYERLGAVKEGVLRSAMRLTDGSWADLALYSMMPIEAEAALRRIEALWAVAGAD